RWLALTRDLAALSRAGRAPVPSLGTTLLSPFDSLLWHRERVARLFGFDYRIEVYTPGPKRVHGYYTLPILHHGQLIGRLDAKAHRAERRLEVRHVHFEPWFAAAETPPRGWDRVDQDEALRPRRHARAPRLRRLRHRGPRPPRDLRRSLPPALVGRATHGGPARQDDPRAHRGEGYSKGADPGLRARAEGHRSDARAPGR